MYIISANCILGLLESFNFSNRITSSVDERGLNKILRNMEKGPEKSTHSFNNYFYPLLRYYARLWIYKDGRGTGYHI